LQDKYRERRKLTHEEMKSFSRSDYVGCFHDGFEPLNVVKDFHKEVLSLCREMQDQLKPLIVEVIEGQMMVGPAKERSRARDYDTSLSSSCRTLNKLHCLLLHLRA